MKKVEIYIPTLDRIGLHRQITLKQFWEHSVYKPILVCPEDEVKHHLKYTSEVLGCPKKGIGKTRQWILRKSRAKIVIMSDDDMRFQYRPDPLISKLKEYPDLNELVYLIKRCVHKGYIHGGMADRNGNNRVDCSSPRKGVADYGGVFIDCIRVNNFHYVHRRKVLDLGIKFNRLPVMEDFHFTLSMLLAGYANRVIYNYVWRQDASGGTGGCSTYRTPEVQARGANGLHKAFPDFVTVVDKETKDTSNYWEGMKTRKDVRVQWLQAARAGGIEI
jgi:hypothetical protein